MKKMEIKKTAVRNTKKKKHSEFGREGFKGNNSRGRSGSEIKKYKRKKTKERESCEKQNRGLPSGVPEKKKIESTMMQSKMVFAT